MTLFIFVIVSDSSKKIRDKLNLMKGAAPDKKAKKKEGHKGEEGKRRHSKEKSHLYGRKSGEEFVIHD